MSPGWRTLTSPWHCPGCGHRRSGSRRPCWRSFCRRCRGCRLCRWNSTSRYLLGLFAPSPRSGSHPPPRPPSGRHALNDQQLSEIFHAAATTGNDRELDALILRLHVETACRRGGVLNLRIRDLDPRYSQVYLREKNDTTRWQPVSPTLMHHLQDHIRQRPSSRASRQDRSDNASVLRYRNGRNLTSRRYDHLWNRLREHLPWVAAYNVSAHWLRHTTLTWVERNFGYAVAHAYAGHTDATGDTGSTTTYIRATHEEVAHALATLTNEPHPLDCGPTQAPTQPATPIRHPWAENASLR
ncbi:tyrosine-type recombinase/integrase [Nocardia gipuzkoensis]